jgi:hypothetical protein
MLTANSDGSISDRKPAGRPRTRRLENSECRALMLTLAYREIAEAGPAKLRRIIARIESARMVGGVTGGKEHTKMAADALEIETRAKRRLAWFGRQEAKA